MYIFKHNAKEPLYEQLYRQLRHDILHTLKVGDKLPSIRKMAQQYNLSKTTVESAYGQLYAEGYIESRHKSGYFVADIQAEALHQKGTLSKTLTTPTTQYIYDFFPARLHPNDFPLKTWKRLYNKAMHESLDLGAYPSGQGEFCLRSEISKYLVDSRGVRCSPDQVIVFGSFVDMMALITRMFDSRTDTFVMEYPGYHVVRKVFSDGGYKVKKIEVDAYGLRIDQLQKSDAKIVYITPSHQYPTGVTMPISNRYRLLAWARESGGYIIEDDYDSEMHYKNRPIPSLQGLDSDDRVIYVGTFSKSLSPALRVCYMILPARLFPRYQLLPDIHFPKVSLETQLTLARFMREGYWERHLRKIRNLNRKKHDLMKNTIEKYLGDVATIVAEGGGLAILIQPTVEIHLDLLQHQCIDAKIRIYNTKATTDGAYEAIRMGFGGFCEEEIEPAVKAFAKVWRQTQVK